MTTDTPRRPLRPEELFDEAIKLKERAERAEAEVASLQMEQDGTCNAEELRQERSARQKLEAEVERLKANLRRAIEIAEKFKRHTWDVEYLDAKAALDQLKATLNPTDK